MCKSSLPSNYSLPVLTLTQSSDEIKLPKQLSRQTSLDSTANSININSLISQQNSQSMSSSYLENNESSETRQQVVVVGTPLPTASQPQNVQQGPVMVSLNDLFIDFVIKIRFIAR